MQKLVLIIFLVLFSSLHISAQNREAYYPRGIEMSGDGSRFAITGQQIETNGEWTFPIEIYDSNTYELLLSYPINGIPSSFGLNRDGTKLGYILSNAEFGLVDITDLENPTVLYLASGYTPVEYQDFSWSPIDNDVFAYGIGASIHVSDSGGPRGGDYITDHIVVGTGWTLNGDGISSERSASSGLKQVSLWDIDSNSQTPIMQLGDRFGGGNIALSLVTGQIAIDNISSVSIFDSNLTWIKDIPTELAFSLAWSPDGSELAIATGETLDIWDIETATISYSYDTYAVYVIWLPNGDLIHDGYEPGLYQNGERVTELVPPVLCGDSNTEEQAQNGECKQESV